MCANLGEGQSLRVAAVNALCHWCRKDSRSTKWFKSPVDVRHVKSKLMNLINEDVYDTHKAFDLQVVSIHDSLFLH